MSDRPPSLRARRIVPSRTLPDGHLQLPAAACAACGTDVDPLRTPSLLAFEDGVRVLCSEGCKTDYRAGSRARRKPQLTATPATGTPRVVAPVVAPASVPRVDAPLPADTVRWLALGLVCVALAGVLAFFSNWEVSLFSALCTALGAGAALRASAKNLGEVGVFAWLCGPLGVLAAALAGYLESETRGGDVAQLGAACAGLAVLARAFFDARARTPVEGAASLLRAQLVPQAAAPAPPTDETGPEKARIGEELIVRRGDRVAVDGVVQFGEAQVLPFPAATTSIPRGPGDTLLAGATVVEGGVRVLATRIGEDRSLARALRSGQVHPREGAPLVRFASEVSRYGGLLSLIVACGVLMWGSAGGGVPQLAAASALLVASPWLALRRAAEWPFTAAATAAAVRGVLFQNGSALELAGAVGVVAMTPHRTLTEGNPEVVELHTLGEGGPDANANADRLLGLVAAAELAATDHAIGRSIVKYAQARNAPLAEVRRSVEVIGHGVTALGPTGEEVVVGSRRLLLDHGVSVALAESHAARAEALGRTAVFVSVAGRVRAVLALHDQLRAGARSAVQRMFDMGVEVVLLTGGQRGPVEQLAGRLEITHIKAELSSEERGQEVRSLREAGTKVAVIGYPADDNPSLSAADVGVALGAAGGPAGDRAIALVGEDVRDAAAALWIAHAARGGALSSVRIALIAFACATAAAFSGLLQPIAAALLTLAIDAHCIHTGARLLRRIALRLPSGS